jgi:hypothetical protein
VPNENGQGRRTSSVDLAPVSKLVKNLGTVVVLAAVAIAIYVAAKVVPLYVDNLDVKEAVDAAFNLAGRNNNDSILRAEIRERTSRMGSHVETDTWGNDQVVPGLGLTDDQITIERSRITDNVRIEVNYQREVDLSLFNYVHVLEMRAVKEGIPPN